jgi:4-aminobutyrate aminotransferase/(S)-3-amino-2-methylpropionate transaminase
MVSAQVHRLALGLIPPKGWGNLLSKTLGSIAPPGLTKVQTMACGSCANENAMKVAMIVQSQRRRVAEGRGEDEVTQEEAAATMLNKGPGSGWKVLSFEGAFHGRTLASLSCTRSKAIHKLDVAAMDWPCAPFPHLRFVVSLPSLPKEWTCFSPIPLCPSELWLLSNVTCCYVGRNKQAHLVDSSCVVAHAHPPPPPHRLRRL